LWAGFTFAKAIKKTTQMKKIISVSLASAISLAIIFSIHRATTPKNAVELFQPEFLVVINPAFHFVDTYLPLFQK
jgi:hypothetical protein